jgi:hypothetical protein
LIVTYQKILRINFPVFKLPSGNWQLIDGLLFLDHEIIDDRNMPGSTLGARRLQTEHENLLPLRGCIDSHLGIIKQSSRHFVDNNGRPFIYEKTKMCGLKYYKIKKVERKTVASILWLKGLKRPFTIPRPPPEGCTWAGILHLNGLPWMLYDYAESEQKNSRKKV